MLEVRRGRLGLHFLRDAIEQPLAVALYVHGRVLGMFGFAFGVRDFSGAFLNRHVRRKEFDRIDSDSQLGIFGAGENLVEGFGNGLAPNDAWAQRGGRGFGGGGGGDAMLLSQDSVQTELKLSEEQKQKIADFLDKQREAFSGLQDLSREERQEKFAEMRKASQQAIAGLLDEAQLKRLKQISLQQRGAQALGVPTVSGRGLLLGLHLGRAALPVQRALFEHRVLTGTASDPNVLRLMPPLSFTAAEAGLLLEALDEVLK